MNIRDKQIAPPSNDPRWREVDAAMFKYGYEPHALIEVLHAAQDTFGYLDMEALRYVSKALHVSPSTVYGVATFYHLFSMEPPAQHSCLVCTGTACHINGAGKILEAINEAVGLKPGQALADGQVSIQTVRCMGCCSPAPVAIFDEEAAGNLDPCLVVARLKGWTNHAA